MAKSKETTTDQRTGWLADLKEGDWVFISAAAFDHTIDRMRITKVTPSGRIVAGPWEFNANGWARGIRGYRTPWLMEPTKEVKEKWRREHLTAAIQDWVRNKIPNESLETLEAVWKLLSAERQQL